MPFIELTELEPREVVKGCHARFVHSPNTTVSYWDLEKGAILPEHSHPHEQVTSLIAGEMELTLDGEKRHLRPGSVAVIPSNGVHSVVALTECYVIDVFYPVREEYR